jgi:hypothetical protein
LQACSSWMAGCTQRTDSGGKINIFAGDFIGRARKRNIRINMCLILNGYPPEMLESATVRALWMVMRKEILLTGDFVLVFNLKFQWQILSQRNDKFVTVHNKHSNTPWKQALFTNVERSVLMLTVGFSDIYCEPQQMFHFCLTN